jgi:hypothetical protein
MRGAGTGRLPPTGAIAGSIREVDVRFPPPPGAAVAALLAGAALLARSELTGGVLAAVLNGADLVFHEAGHPILGLLGSRFLMFLGGTLGQLAFPVAAAVTFLRRRQLAPLGVALVWLGFNLVDVGRYMADAEARALPLLTGEPSTHDWWNLLGMLGIREAGPALGWLVGALGWGLQAAAPMCVAAHWLRQRLVVARGSR